MNQAQRQQRSYFFGICASLLMHIGLAVSAVFFLQHNAANALRPQEVFTVTLEGGEQLGGAFQLPKEGKEHKKPPTTETPSSQSEVPVPTQTEKQTEVKKASAVEETEPAKAEKKLTEPSVVDDPQKQLEAKRLQEKKEREKKAQEEKKKKADEAKKKAEQEKKKAEEAKKKAEEAKKAAAKKQEEERLRAERERKARDARFAALTRRIKNTYEGESVNAGGTGFGAARLGGKGGGGGTLASAEKIAYANALQQHVKSGWRWLPSSKRYIAVVVVQLLPNGTVQDVRIESGSGNGTFDDSVLRAVRKANPVPPPPASLYEDFRTVRMTFDSAEK